MLFLLPLVRPCLARYVAMAPRRTGRSSSASHASAWTLRTRPSPDFSSPAILVTSQTALPTVIAVRLRQGLPRPLRAMGGGEECTGARGTWASDGSCSPGTAASALIRRRHEGNINLRHRRQSQPCDRPCCGTHRRTPQCHPSLDP